MSLLLLFLGSEKIFLYHKLKNMKKLLLSLTLLTSVFSSTKAQTYCTPSFPGAVASCSTYGLVVQSFLLTGASGAINDNSACNGTGYLDQTAMSCSIQAGQAYTFTTSTGPYGSEAQVWIDFNNDGTFASNETVAGTSNYANVATMNLSVPVNGALGAHRMRVLTAYSGTTNGDNYPTLNPCSGYYYGEARDYMVTILAPPGCSGTPNQGSVSAVRMQHCGAFTPYLSVTGSNLNDTTGYNYQWMSSVDNITFSPVATATNSTYNGTVSNTLYYTCQLTCANSGLSSLSSSQLISTTLTPTPGTSSAVLAASCGAFTPQLSISGYGTGDSSGVSYQWMSSADNVTFAPVATATNNTYNGVVSSTLYYDCQVTCPSGGGSASSSSELINVNPAPTAGSVSANVVSNCGSFMPQLSLSGASDPSLGFSYQWMSSTDNITFTPVATATNNTYNPTISNAVYYTCQLSCGGTNTVNATSQLFDPNPTITAGSVLAVSSAGCGVFAPQLSLSGTSDPSLGFSYQWMSSVDNSTFAPVATATNSTYNGTVSNTLYYTCQLTCTSTNTVSATSQLITINATPTIVNNTCANLTTTLTASGGTSFTWSPSASLNTATGSVVVTTASVATNYMVTNDLGCSNSIFVSASDSLTIMPQVATACTSTGDTLYANAFLNKGLVAYYPFNGDANDYSGNGHNATTVGVSLATDRFGNSGKCYSFAGTSTYLACPPAAYFTGGDFTISGWVNVSNVQAWGRLIDFGNGPGSDNVLVSLNGGGSGQLLSSSTGQNFQSGQALDYNKWVQVLFTFDATTNISTCYYNGIAIDSGTINRPNNVVRNNAYIGLSDWPGDGGVFGSMDDIRIYNRELNSTEIGQLYNFEATAEAQTTYSWSNGATTPYIVANSTTPSTVTYSVTQTRNGASCTMTNTISVTTVACPAALNFDGVDDYVNLGNNIDAVLQNTNLITVEAWINPSTTSNLGVIAGNFNTQNNNGMQFLLRRDNNLFTFWVDGGSGFQNVTSIGTPTINVWQHIAGTWDGSSLKIYINGVLDNTTQNITGAFNMEANNIWIGTDNSGEYFTGSMDEMRIWNTARTPAQIQNDMGCINSSTVTPTGLLAYYNFDNGVANATNTGRTTVADATGDGNNGELINFALNGTTSNWVTDASMLSVKPSITSVVATNTAICVGATTTLTVNSTASTYTWSTNAASATTTTVSVTPANTATYNVTAANSYCMVMDSVVVTVNPLPTVTVNSATVCVGNMATLTASGTATSYTWSTTATTPTISVTPTTPTSYTVSGTDANHCVNMATATVSVNALPSVSVTVTNSVICAGASTTLSGAGADTYTWTGGVVDNTVFNPTGTNTYTVTGTENTHGCTNTASQLVTVNPLPTVTVNSSTICTGATATLTASGTATSYTWSTTATTPTISVAPTTPTSYTVSGTDANHCVNMATATVSVNALPTISVNTSTVDLCVGATATLTASGTATSYTWSTTATTPSIAVSPTVNATYTVTGSDNGCKNTIAFTQTVSTTCQVGIEKYNTGVNVTVYPNPSTGLYAVTLDADAQITVINSLGEVVLVKTLHAGTENIDIQNQVAGVYFVKVIQYNNQQTIKLIKN